MPEEEEEEEDGQRQEGGQDEAGPSRRRKQGARNGQSDGQWAKKQRKKASGVGELMNSWRNRLGEPHLNVAAHVFGQDQLSLESFPYDQALQLWHAASPKRGRYMPGLAEWAWGSWRTSKPGI